MIRIQPVRVLVALTLVPSMTLGAATGARAQVQVPRASRTVAYQATYEATPCPSPNVPGAPQLDLGPEFSCGYLTVPEDRARPDGRRIRVAVARASAASPDPRPDPIVYLAGGPGGTGLATAVQKVQEGWNRDRDVIFVDQRGTLHAEPLLSCPEIDAFLRQQVGLAPTDPATRVQDVAAVRACHDRLAGQGYDLAAYNTPENAADIADLRVALGIPAWNVYGVSYGTDLALQLLRDHPQGIRSLVLDSLVPTDVNLMDGFWPNAAAGYRAVVDACATQAPCNAAYPQLGTELETAIDQLNQRHLSVQVPDRATGQNATVVFDGYQAANLFAILSLYPGSFVGMPRLVHELAGGDGSHAGAALLATVSSPPGLVGYGLTYGVFCREQVAFTDRERVLAAAQRALPAFPAPVLALVPQSPRIFDECAVWDVGRADPAVHDPVRSGVPVLLLTGTFDAITPPAWAERAAAGLTNGRVVRVPGVGHDVSLWSECGRTVMLNFLQQPEGGYDDGCLDTLTVPPFATGAG
jgi:pimeloyl-ACP methyl ester carboxylesterase